MRKIERIFITASLLTIIAVTGGAIWYHTTKKSHNSEYQFPASRFGAFLATQHAIHVNDFDSAREFTKSLTNEQIPIVQSTIYISDFLSGRMPFDAHLLKSEKTMPARIIYDAYLVKNNNWKELHNRHKTDESALAAPLRIWPAIANDWRTNTFKFIDKLPTNQSWKSFVRGQIYAELGDTEKAAEHFGKVSADFMNINDYIYIMSFYKHHNMPDRADILQADFTSRPGGMFMMGYDNFPDWSVFSGYTNALAFSLIQNISHTQIMMYSDLAMLLLRFVQVTAPEFAANNNTLDYYLGQYFYNNVGDYEKFFSNIKSNSPFYPFARLRIADKNKDIRELEKILDEYPLFVPAANQAIAHHIKHGNRRDAMRIVKDALNNDNLNEAGRAFFIKNRAQINFAFGNIKDAQKDIRAVSKLNLIDSEVISLQAKIWAAQNRELENAYDYAMGLVRQNPTDILAWDTLGYVVSVREGVDAALELLERVGEISETCSSLFVNLGDMYAAKGEVDKAKDAYKRAIDLSDDGLTVVPDIERKIRKLK